MNSELFLIDVQGVHLPIVQFNINCSVSSKYSMIQLIKTQKRLFYKILVWLLLTDARNVRETSPCIETV